MSDQKTQFPYLHGFSKEEQDRLRKQAEFGEYTIFQDINLSTAKKLLEVGCGVGAQSEIILRRFPKLHLTGIDQNEAQLAAAREMLEAHPQYRGRFELQKMDAHNMDFESNGFDHAFLCWILEHVADPRRVLSEVRRVLKPGGKVYVTEVMNSTFFLDPYSPHVWKYWMAFNDYQFEGAGDPFIGAKLGNLLSAVGFERVQTRVKTWHLDNRYPEKRREIIDYWMDLLLSASDQLVKTGYTDQDTVDKAKSELRSVRNDPNAVFFYSFMQAEARVSKNE